VKPRRRYKITHCSLSETVKFQVSLSDQQPHDILNSQLLTVRDRAASGSGRSPFIAQLSLFQLNSTKLLLILVTKSTHTHLQIL